MMFVRRQRRLALTSAQWTPVLIWGGWLLVTAIVFSYAQGIIHPYYTVALAPAIGAVIGILVSRLWSERSVAGLRLLAGCVAVTVVWTVALLNRTPMWQPWMRAAIVAGGLAAVALWIGRRPRLSSVAAGLGIVVSLMAPVAYSVNAARAAHDGAIPIAGPAIVLSVTHVDAPAPAANARASVPVVDPSVMGGMLRISRPSRAAVEALLENADAYPWVAATPGGNNAAGLELATRRAVIGLGGFNATDPSPTLEQFQRMVAQRKVHFFVADDTFPYPVTDEPPADQIAAWVEQNFPHVSYGKIQIYDLTASPETGA
jgi:4-amino-4-deoxy-L-arabinose transferase-like glycosyltransferase